MRRWIRWAVGCVAVLALLVPLAQASGSTPASVHLFAIDGTRLKPGAEMQMQASVPIHDFCELTLSHAGLAPDSSHVVRSASALAEFAWRTPKSVASGRWVAQVACSASRRAGRAGFRSAAVRLTAPARSHAHGAAARSIRVLYPVADAQPVTGKGAGAYARAGTPIIAASAWLSGHGVTVYSDGGDGADGYYQCVELINRLITTLGWSPHISGNANQIYGNASSTYFVKHANGSGYMPVPGDIIVWGGGYEGYGHVQVVNTVSSGELNVVEQNASASGYNIVPISSSGTVAPRAGGYYVEGFLHAKANNIGQAAAPAPVVTPAPTPTPAPTTSSPAAGTYAETAGGVAHTWSNAQTAGGTQGPDVANGQTIDVTCKATGYTVSDGDSWWYLIASSPWNGVYWVSADAFYNNGATSGSLQGTPQDDPAVPACPSQGSTTTPTTTTTSSTPAPTPTPAPTTPTSTPAPAPTYSETVGSVAHTWTNYSDAGGTEGPSIASNQTVQITCKVTGFKVSDGNTWWYEIASSPWNNQYYVSADAFYNNGATSGSLHGTPFVDPNVPNC